MKTETFFGAYKSETLCFGSRRVPRAGRRAVKEDRRQVSRGAEETDARTARPYSGPRLATRVGVVYQALRPRQRRGAELPFALRVPHGDQ